MQFWYVHCAKICLHVDRFDCIKWKQSYIGDSRSVNQYWALLIHTSVS